MPGYAMACPRSVATDPTSAPIAHPTAGNQVIMSPFSGPAGSPFDTDSSNNASTGALSTGIGFGCIARVPGQEFLFDSTKPVSVNNFDSLYQPGLTLPAGTTAPDARLLAIGGGRSTANSVASPTTPNPYVAQPLLNTGNGGARDAGSGPAYTGFGMKNVTAAGDIANGSAIVTGWVNRQGVTLKSGLSQFGSSTAASPAVT